MSTILYVKAAMKKERPLCIGEGKMPFRRERKRSRRKRRNSRRSRRTSKLTNKTIGYAWPPVYHALALSLTLEA